MFLRLCNEKDKNHYVFVNVFPKPRKHNVLSVNKPILLSKTNILSPMDPPKLLQNQFLYKEWSPCAPPCAPAGELPINRPRGLGRTCCHHFGEIHWIRWRVPNRANYICVYSKSDSGGNPVQCFFDFFIPLASKASPGGGGAHRPGDGGWEFVTSK